MYDSLSGGFQSTHLNKTNMHKSNWIIFTQICGVKFPNIFEVIAYRIHANRILPHIPFIPMRSARAHLNLDTSTIFLSGSTCENQRYITATQKTSRFFFVFAIISKIRILKEERILEQPPPPTKKKQKKQQHFYLLLPPSLYLHSICFKVYLHC